MSSWEKQAYEVPDAGDQTTPTNNHLHVRHHHHHHHHHHQLSTGRQKLGVAGGIVVGVVVEVVVGIYKICPPRCDLSAARFKILMKRFLR